MLLLRYDVQSWVAELADAGCEAITLGVEPDGDEDDVEEVITLCKELDVLGVPMRYRLGLRFDRDSDDWALLGNRVHIASCAARHLLFPRFASILSRRCSL
jgi:hypothetical protein|eukprot:COSAG02_NODE_252_length_26996_cov_29.825607_16_plen_101_part_00